ncbi:hypothetical protein Ancab_024294 [Ancistrocladus abbreviatus]
MTVKRGLGVQHHETLGQAKNRKKKLNTTPPSLRKSISNQIGGPMHYYVDRHRPMDGNIVAIVWCCHLTAQSSDIFSGYGLMLGIWLDILWSLCSMGMPQPVKVNSRTRQCNTVSQRSSNRVYVLVEMKLPTRRSLQARVLNCQGNKEAASPHLSSL